MTDSRRGDPQTEAAAELVELVEADGTVIEVVTRAAMRAGRRRHRCTYVMVVDSADRVVVHQRAAWKDVWPSRWDLGFGGVVGVGESFADAAHRELAEEAGVAAELVDVGGGTYDDGDVSLLGRVYLARSDGPFTFPDGEVVASERVALADLDAWLGTHEVCPDSVAVTRDLRRRLAGETLGRSLVDLAPISGVVDNVAGPLNTDEPTDGAPR